MSDQETASFEALTEKLDRLARRVEDLAKLASQFGVYMGDGTILVQTSGGLRFYVYADDQIMTPKLIGNRVWEPTVTRYMLQLLRPERDFIDVGANIGYFTCLIASRIGVSGGGRVFAIEPNPRALELLKRNVSINWSMAPIEIVECAAARQSGDIAFYAPRRLIANASMYASAQAGGDDDVDEVRVEAARLDDLILDKDRVGLMKVDVEGGEFDALSGAEQLLRANRDIDIVMEWSTSQMRNSPGKMAGLVDYLRGLDFKPYLIGKTAEPVSWETLAETSYANLHLKR